MNKIKENNTHEIVFFNMWQDYRTTFSQKMHFNKVLFQCVPKRITGSIKIVTQNQFDSDILFYKAYTYSIYCYYCYSIYK